MSVNRLKQILLAFLLSIGIILTFVSSQTVRADVESDQVLLVYDSSNEAENAQVKIDALQRSLTSMNLWVKTVNQKDYQKNMLNQHYLGVITMINWEQVGLHNQDFIKDRAKFSGIKLHIGNNLTDREISDLDVKVKRLYQQQLLLTSEGNKKLLPFSQNVTLVSKASSTSDKVGTLKTQDNLTSYPFGFINGESGYLPFFSASGLEMLTQVQFLAKLFHRVGKYHPVLTFTNVSPYSNLDYLDELSDFCYQNQIPFAISTVSVSKNIEMKAFSRFTKVLRNVENRGGVIFLQMPEMVTTADSNGEILEQMMRKYLVSLAKEQVFPVGISAKGFWNQDTILRSHSLQFSDNWLLLPNESKPLHLQEDNDAQVARQNLLALPAQSLNRLTKTQETTFSAPMALTISMPNTKKSMQQAKSKINNLDLSWYDPVADNLQTRIETDTTVVEYRGGDYFVNGKREAIQATNKVFNKQFSDGKPKSSFSRYFRIQGDILTVFFIIIMIIFIVFIFIGRRIYWNRFKR
ncbi:hypothetical protein [Companilactobacillus halodurans]|uniref:DUF2334 domain-containing protein n=1 Tax=Companilactobacillus halodurans TaxID=2584183 RepID=A0A5P0ZP15_9LACO|nr:hypothetical protein [Companilactobacillus halodurans]MQS75581.1 hypothetical protein [Companilactobacillus halodurans]MQS96295.1 hypothetical protein [Companilactobacillus halodurans]